MNGEPYDGVSPLYGVTGGGGANDGGTVFELINSDGHWSETVLYNFCSLGGDQCTDGQIPRGVTMGSEGTLYGMTFQGGGNDFRTSAVPGVVFQLAPDIADTWKETTLYRFCSDSALCGWCKAIG